MGRGRALSTAATVGRQKRDRESAMSASSFLPSNRQLPATRHVRITKHSASAHMTARAAKVLGASGRER